MALWTPADLQSIQAQAAAAIDKLETKWEKTMGAKSYAQYEIRCGQAGNIHSVAVWRRRFRPSGEDDERVIAQVTRRFESDEDDASSWSLDMAHSLLEAIDLAASNEASAIDAMAKKWKESRQCE